MSDPDTVLLVEDDDAIAGLFEDWLDDEYEVRVAGTAAAALDALDAAVDIVLLDRRLPDDDGETVARAIRDAGTDHAVVMVTAVEPDFDIVALAIDDYLVKPVDRETLVASVERIGTHLTYDSELSEYYALASKRAVLEERKDGAELADSEEYADLLAACERQRRRADELLQTDETDYVCLFTTLFSGPGAAAR